MYVYVYMYVCVSMYVCRYVCIYVCMYVCVYVLCMYYVCMYICMYVCVYVCMYVRMYVYICMYVCMYINLPHTEPIYSPRSLTNTYRNSRQLVNSRTASYKLPTNNYIILFSSSQNRLSQPLPHKGPKNCDY